MERIGYVARLRQGGRGVHGAITPEGGRREDRIAIDSGTRVVGVHPLTRHARVRVTVAIGSLGSPWRAHEIHVLEPSARRSSRSQPRPDRRFTGRQRSNRR